LWIVDDVKVRLRKIEGWTSLPHFVSVNLSEPGTADLCALLGEMGIGIEGGIASAEDGEVLKALLPTVRFLRALVEVEPRDPLAAAGEAAALSHLVARSARHLPQLHHGYDEATWHVIAAAWGEGHAIRIGLEDTLELPDGTQAPDNEALVRAAITKLGA
jgi:uncharacterized protein (DUF849 family)